ncbi:MAG: hypothetical protein JXJ18_02590 [Rhodobacteraceae bacterium]|nr:hypothetical protein [Paracoccaceae bacterium]
MNISRNQAKIKCAFLSWPLAAVMGLTVAVIAQAIGLWSLGAFIGGVGTFVVVGWLMTMTFCRTDAELAAARANERAIAAARAPYKAANDAIVIPDRPKPVGPKVVPTVPKSAPKAAAPKPAPKPAAAPAPKPAPAPAAAAVGKRPVALSAARAGGADDLKKIKGVGPKLEKLCNSLGFYHFDQIAAWTPAEVAWVDENLEGFKGRVSREDWVSQAKTLAAGGETEFSKKVDEGDVY